MSGRTVELACFGVVAIASLGGCVTTAPTAQNGYNSLRCDSPGAIPTEAMGSKTEVHPPQSAASDPSATTGKASAQCALAASDPSRPSSGVGRFKFGRAFEYGHFDGNHRGHDFSDHANDQPDVDVQSRWLSYKSITSEFSFQSCERRWRRISAE